jgi:hypothetical protein
MTAITCPYEENTNPSALDMLFNERWFVKHIDSKEPGWQSWYKWNEESVRFVWIRWINSKSEYELDWYFTDENNNIRVEWIESTMIRLLQETFTKI